MADSPSPIASSAAGAPLQAKDAAEAREARRAGQHNAARTHVKIVDDAGATVETTDADSRVFTDAEGTGSQGRQLDDELEPAEQHSAGAEPEGITKDKDGKIHLDLQA